MIANRSAAEPDPDRPPDPVRAAAEYGNCPHGFTDPLEEHGVYHPRAADQSHASMRHFYAARLGLPWAC